MSRRGARETPKPSRDPAALRAWPALFAGLFVLALAWRLAYVARLAQSPLSGSLTADARVYWEWASVLLHSGPLGSEPFFLGPLYPYVLAPLRALLGDSIERVLWAQAIGGAAAVTLLAGAAARVTRPALGLVVGALLCFYEPFVFFDGLILGESLLLLLEAALLAYVVRNYERLAEGRGLWVAGVLIGLLTLGRASGALLALPLLAAVLPWRAAPARAARAAVVLALVILAVIAPALARNAMLARQGVFLTYNLGFNLYVGNHPDATGAWAPVGGGAARFALGGRDGGGELDGRDAIREREGRDLNAAESSAYWSQQALAWVRDQPARAAGLALRKLAMLWNRHEYPQIENADVYRRAAGPLGIPGLGSFAFLGALAVAGAWFARSYGAAGRMALGYVAIVTLGILPFFVTDRYRVHLVPGAALLAAFALDRAWRIVAAFRARDAGRLALALLVGVLVVSLPVPHLSRERSEWESLADIGSRWLERGRADLALPALRQAAEIERREALAHRGTARSRGERGALHADLGFALVRQAGGGEARFAEAARHFETAVAMDLARHEVWEALIRAHLQLRQYGRADSALTRAQAAGLAPASYWAHAAAIAAATGRADSARAALARVPEEAISRDAGIRAVVTGARRLLGNVDR